MRIPLSVVAVLVVAHVAVPDARAATTSGWSIRLQRASDGLFVAGHVAGPFTLAGVRWQGSGQVELRTRSLAGRWSAWRRAAPEAEDAPDALAPESRRASWRLGNPWWVGASNDVQARARGHVTRIVAELVSSQPLEIPYRSPALTQTPAIVMRAAWGADESIRRGPPAYAPDVRLVIVHHTAGTNDYTRAQAPAIVRGIERFHVQSNGWNDIGYNFLVDRFGTVYEGRFGGVDRNVIGAHALGFNTGSVGIALIGSYGATSPSQAALAALERMIAWRLDLAHVDPTSSLTVTSGGSEKYANGVPVQLRAVSGHRDTGSTECPGNQLYARLGEIAAQARSIGGPKIFEPRAQATSATVRVRARLSTPLPWTVTVATRAGAEVARGAGTGTSVDWTWDAASAAPGTYVWTIATAGARPAIGTVKAGSAPTTEPAIESATLTPDAISPNGDGQADTALLSYRLTTAAIVTVQVSDITGAVVATPVVDAPTAAGDHTTVVSGDTLADGEYYVSLIARFSNGTTSQATFPLTVSRTLGLVSIAPALFSPNGDGRNDALSVAFTLAAPASVRVLVQRGGRWVATPYSADVQAGAQTVTWDGTRTGGRIRDGSYTAVVEATGGAGSIAGSATFTVDTTAPRVRFVPARRIRLEVTEAALLMLRVDGRLMTKDVRRPGTVVVPVLGEPRRIAVVATDAAGNRSAPVVARRGKDGKLRQ
jgi:flagellar hook assembly protein FlgD